MDDGRSGLQLRSLLKKSGELEISLVNVPTPEPADDEVVVRVEASPINPSDLGLLVGAADMTSAKASGTKDAPVITAKVPACPGTVYFFVVSWRASLSLIMSNLVSITSRVFCQPKTFSGCHWFPLKGMNSMNRT